MLRAVRKAGEDQQRWIRVVAFLRVSASVYYVSRSTCHVVDGSPPAPTCQVPLARYAIGALCARAPDTDSFAEGHLAVTLVNRRGCRGIAVLGVIAIGPWFFMSHDRKRPIDNESRSGELTVSRQIGVYCE